jgi:hypothetical protein
LSIGSLFGTDFQVTDDNVVERENLTRSEKAKIIQEGRKESNCHKMKLQCSVLPE